MIPLMRENRGADDAQIAAPAPTASRAALPAPGDGRRHEHGRHPGFRPRTTKDQGCTRASPSSRLSFEARTVMIDPKDLVVDFRSYFLRWSPHKATRRPQRLPAPRARLQSRQLPAHAGDARADQGLVADQPEGEADQDRREGRQPRPLCRLPDGRGCRAEDAVRRDPAADRRTAATVAAAPGMSIAGNDRWQPDGRGVSMSDRDQPNAARKAGASLMTRVDADEGAGSSPRRLAASGATADDRPSEAGHPENPS